jgi:hypothetical protein
MCSGYIVNQVYAYVEEEGEGQIVQDLNDDCKNSDYTFIFNLLKWRGGILLETIFPGILLKY